jgi:hypothetical protein
MTVNKKQSVIRMLVGVAVFGAVLSPAVASAVTDDTTVTATVNSVISVTSLGAVGMTVTPDVDGEIATAVDTVTVDSNDPDGYNLTLENDTTLTMAGPNSQTLAKTAGTFGAPAALSTNSWGYRLSGFAANTYAGVEDAAQAIESTATTASADPTEVTYAVNVNTSKPAGAYSDTVTYTATVK